ncbi:MAG: NAD(P)/FAD-dependent oxidoreductase [Ruminococcaceae bacterium]|nr:NAD(P)/FAD-dependent oxidoreductase [Oscillospiraceae bacterium]
MADAYISPSYTVAVVGAGAAGMLAAATVSESLRDGGFDVGRDVRVLMLERNDRVGKKLRITGKGRCNLTNDCDRDEFLSNVPTNPRFLYTALAQFSPQDTRAYLEELGVPLKVERGKRVFPVSDKASDVVDALYRHCRELGVELINKKVTGLHFDDGGVCGVKAGAEMIGADFVLLATGGCSYPTTGSDGLGHKLAASAGHSIEKICPSLVPIVCEGNICSRMMGLSLRNVRLKVVRCESGATVFEDFGELLFTHFGITGPLVLSASAHIPDLEAGKYEILIDLKPALDDKTLDTRIVSDFAKYSNRDFINALSDLLPQKAIEPVADLTGIPYRKKVNAITKEERGRLVSVLHGLKLSPVRFRPIAEAIVTKGGVSVKEVSPKTMESKLVRGLYFAGEILDLDAYTGGFNLQIAFSTARAAGGAIAREIKGY